MFFKIGVPGRNIFKIKLNFPGGLRLEYTCVDIACTYISTMKHEYGNYPVTKR
jgi:hypothetical protein